MPRRSLCQWRIYYDVNLFSVLWRDLLVMTWLSSQYYDVTCWLWRNSFLSIMTWLPQYYDVTCWLWPDFLSIMTWPAGCHMTSLLSIMTWPAGCHMTSLLSIMTWPAGCHMTSLLSIMTWPAGCHMTSLLSIMTWPAGCHMTSLLNIVTQCLCLRATCPRSCAWAPTRSSRSFSSSNFGKTSGRWRRPWRKPNDSTVQLRLATRELLYSDSTQLLEICDSTIIFLLYAWNWCHNFLTI